MTAPEDFQYIATTMLTNQARLDWDGMFSVMHDYGVFELGFQKVKLSGREEIIRRMGPALAEMPDLVFTDIVTRPLVEAGWALVTYSGSSTRRATGLPYLQNYITVMQVIDGKIALFQEYFDTLTLALAAGRVSPPTGFPLNEPAPSAVQGGE